MPTDEGSRHTEERHSKVEEGSRLTWERTMPTEGGSRFIAGDFPMEEIAMAHRERTTPA
jgi:hypothetical protein